ncbi:MAG TPA: WYL domain-containing protein [Nitriliruptoraceae bacterium]|nr:WYL domain-containing protein [Nitriliruptoraceae bacterium]
MTAVDAARRALALVPWLLERPGATLAEAAEVVGASPDVVRRDLEMLCYCGGPGLGGGSMFDIDIVGDQITVHMAPGLDEPLRLTPAEATRLVLTLAAVVDVMGDQLPALASAVGKIRDAAGLDEAVVAATVDADHRLADLRTAIAEGCVVQLVYRGRRDEEPLPRTIDPWRLEFTPDGWYLHGHDHDRDDHRVFLVDRIHQVSVRSERAATTAPDDLPSPQWVPTGDAVVVRLRLTGGARVLGERVRLLTDQDADGVREVTFETDSLGWATEVIAVAGDGVEIVSPPDLATLVAAHGQRGLAAMASVPGQDPAD